MGAALGLMVEQELKDARSAVPFHHDLFRYIQTITEKVRSLAPLRSETEPLRADTEGADRPVPVGMVRGKLDLDTQQELNRVTTSTPVKNRDTLTPAPGTCLLDVF